MGFLGPEEPALSPVSLLATKKTGEKAAKAHVKRLGRTRKWRRRRKKTILGDSEQKVKKVRFLTFLSLSVRERRDPGPLYHPFHCWTLLDSVKNRSEHGLIRHVIRASGGFLQKGRLLTIPSKSDDLRKSDDSAQNTVQGALNSNVLHRYSSYSP